MSSRWWFVAAAAANIALSAPLHRSKILPLRCAAPSPWWCPPEGPRRGPVGVPVVVPVAEAEEDTRTSPPLSSVFFVERSWTEGCWWSMGRPPRMGAWSSSNCSRRKMDMRFRLLSKSFVARICHVRRAPFRAGVSQARTCSVRATNAYCAVRAPSTKAPSSGDSAWYLTLSSPLFSTTTVLHNARDSSIIAAYSSSSSVARIARVSSEGRPSSEMPSPSWSSSVTTVTPPPSAPPEEASSFTA
mmetsp:Transcript_29453/g.94968  ORF Transcript_29453/g.94968 Transcript_29453/m.94968 type:complete len:244 (+) Transcript_29453:615-1346(+)